MTQTATFLAGLALGLAGNTLNALIDDSTKPPLNVMAVGLRSVLFVGSLGLAGAAYGWGSSETASRRLWFVTWAVVFALLAIVAFIGGTAFVAGLKAP